MAIDKETVEKIAGLARIRMEQAEVDSLVPELNAVLAWVDQLGEVDVRDVAPLDKIIANDTRLREDVVNADTLTGNAAREDLLANAPQARHGFFAVPRIIE